MTPTEKVTLTSEDVGELKLTEEVKLTREEIIKEVTRRKAGEKPATLDKAHELIVQDLLIGRHCRGTLAPGVRQKVNALLAEEKLEEAMKVDAQGRSACGYDFNQTIMAGAFDGKVHEYECPNCGLNGEYKAPLLVK